LFATKTRKWRGWGRSSGLKCRKRDVKIAVIADIAVIGKPA
jgi:hypothetical protein